MAVGIVLILIGVLLLARTFKGGLAGKVVSTVSGA